MVKSFLHWEKICEYFSDTVGYINGELAYFNDFDYDCADEGCGMAVTYTPFKKDAPRDSVYLEGSTYDDFREHIEPYFPESGWFATEHGPSLILCTHTRGYKRSFNLGTPGQFYSTTHHVSTVRKVWPMQEFPTIEDAYSECNDYTPVPISFQFSVRGNGMEYKELCYLQTPVGIVTHTGEIHLHPVYAPLLKKEVQKIL